MCTCHDSADHEIARRRTDDGKIVTLWSDGAVAGAMGFAIAGVPVLRPRTAAGLDVALRAGWLLLGEVEIHDAANLPALYAACRWAAERSGLPGEMRARLRQLATPTIRPTWDVVSADRDGRPTERVWRLPRLRWPGLAVFDFPNRAERYEVFYVHRGDRRAPSDYATTTGCRFATLADLAAHLHSIPASPPTH